VLTRFIFSCFLDVNRRAGLRRLAGLELPLSCNFHDFDSSGPAPAGISDSASSCDPCSALFESDVCPEAAVSISSWLRFSGSCGASAMIAATFLIRRGAEILMLPFSSSVKFWFVATSRGGPSPSSEIGLTSGAGRSVLQGGRRKRRRRC